MADVPRDGNVPDKKDRDTCVVLGALKLEIL
jgi:hypothetical protein